MARKAAKPPREQDFAPVFAIFAALREPFQAASKQIVLAFLRAMRREAASLGGFYD
jgi:hypothetical protein